MGPAISDYYMWLILLSVIQLSGGHCAAIVDKLECFDGKIKTDDQTYRN